MSWCKEFRNVLELKSIESVQESFRPLFFSSVCPGAMINRVEFCSCCYLHNFFFRYAMLLRARSSATCCSALKTWCRKWVIALPGQCYQLLRVSTRFETGHCKFHQFLQPKAGPVFCSRCSDWLRAGRPKDGSSSPGEGKIFLLFMQSRPVLGLKQSTSEAKRSPPISA
jgi:hypothetical protein